MSHLAVIVTIALALPALPAATYLETLGLCFRATTVSKWKSGAGTHTHPGVGVANLAES